jgi:polyphosphate kinase
MNARKTPTRKTPTRKTQPRKPAARAVAPIRDFDQPQFFINRELSWLEFNARVLEEAFDTSNPILERLKFLTIVSSNLDEFFEVRVAGLQQQAESQPHRCGPDGMTPGEVLGAIATRARELVNAQYRCYREQIVPGLAEQGIELLTVDALSPKAYKWVRDYFQREVFPVLTPLAIDPAHPFPQLLNKSLNLAVVLSIPDTPGQLDGLKHDDSHDDMRFGVVQVPRVLPRLVALPPDVSTRKRAYVFLSSIISEHIGDLFPGLEVQGCYAFRVTRNSELYLDEDEADNLLEAVREQLLARRRGDAVRLEVQRGCDPAVVEMLLHTFELEPIDLYEVDGPVNLPRLMTVYSNEKRPDLKDEPFVTAKPRALRNLEVPEELFSALRHEDILLHHPYDSFKSVVDFISMAAQDPNVHAIKQTLYRTSGDSPIVKALVRAAENGKQVTALVELKARFDEENNIRWARRMEEAGVHVLYGLVGLKTHCKMALVVRHEGNTIRRYVHLGTGNYNPVTARLYTDVGLLSARPDIGEEVAKIFNLLTGMSQFPGLQKLKMAPFGLHDDFRRLIEREAAHAKRYARRRKAEGGRLKKTDHVSTHNANFHPSSLILQPSEAPRIVAKMNALVDPDIIKALYRASQAGVQIDLIVRGICCLRPGVPGLSDNIRVRSIVDRFLEHSRVFYFANGGNEEILCGSADWMPRNFFRRIETVFPVEDERLKARLRDELLGAALADNVKARLLKPDGKYERARRAPGEAPLRSQSWLLERAHSGELGAPDRLDTRPVAAPDGHVPPAMSGFELVPRSAPQAIPPHAVDARAGTEGDPVLRAVEEERPVREEERSTTTVVSDEAQSSTQLGTHNASEAGAVPEANVAREANATREVDATHASPLKSARKTAKNSSTRKKP